MTTLRNQHLTERHHSCPLVPPARVSPPARPSRPETALICRDAYRTYAMLAPVNNARVTVRRVLADAG
jgi:hypothetical protein